MNLDALSKATGQKLPGGCDDCTAYQQLEEISPNIYVLEIRHDDTCPTLTAIERKQTR